MKQMVTGTFGVHATGSGGAKSVDITIADDETASTSISLSISPHTVAEGDWCYQP